ncbi:MAG TPA: VCBS repeat-containing protein, partial [Bdellovibrionota bacterium]|nr:VCBS repeat-containing protein [Bdellovibrionota bacterium]
GDDFRKWLSGPEQKAAAEEVRAFQEELDKDAPSLLPKPQSNPELWAKFEKVRDFYLHTAPKKPTPLPPAPKPVATAPFDVRPILPDAAAPGGSFTTLVGEGPQPGTVWVGGMSFGGGPPRSHLERWRFKLAGADLTCSLEASIPTASPAVSAVPAGGGDFWVTLIGDLKPEQSEKAEIQRLKWDSKGPPAKVVGGLLRSAGAQSADLDGDGNLDLVFHGFGYHLGHLSILWGPVTSSSKEEVIDEGPGPMFSRFVDLDGDGKMDFVTIMSQHREELVWFHNLGNRKFERKLLLKFPPTRGLTDLQFADFDGDGVVDLAVSNGDNSDLANPPPRPDHGVRIYRAEGGWKKAEVDLKEAYYYPMQGASQIAASDFDGDGDTDLAVVARFHGDSKTDPHFALLENDGRGRFKIRNLAEMEKYSPIELTAADLTGRGRKADLLVGLRAYPKDGPKAPRWLALTYKGAIKN